MATLTKLLKSAARIGAGLFAGLALLAVLLWVMLQRARDPGGNPANLPARVDMHAVIDAAKTGTAFCLSSKGRVTRGPATETELAHARILATSAVSLPVGRAAAAIRSFGQTRTCGSTRGGGVAFEADGQTVRAEFELDCGRVILESADDSIDLKIRGYISPNALATITALVAKCPEHSPTRPDEFPR